MSSNDAQAAGAGRYPRVLSIAGSDSGGGAGIQADLKTFSALGCYGMTAITAITAQNTVGVAAVDGIAPAMVLAQIQAVVEDIGVDAVKIGMLHSPALVEAVAQAIDRFALPRVVLDPVMVATSGDRLLEPEAVRLLVAQLFPRAVVVTPNLDEAALLLGREITGVDALDAAADDLLSMGAHAVLVKGGHLVGDQVVDVLAQAGGGAHRRFESPRIASRNVHGTGCTLSSAIAAHLAMGATLPLAVEQARGYVLAAIAAGAQVQVGHGHGPLNHGHAPIPARVLR